MTEGMAQVVALSSISTTSKKSKKPIILYNEYLMNGKR
jgi:hypothetical protein